MSKQFQLIEDAVEDRWPITSEIRQRLVDSMMTIVLSGEPKEATAAARVLASMDKQSTDLRGAAEGLTIEELQRELVARLTGMATTEAAEDPLKLCDGRRDPERDQDR